MNISRASSYGREPKPSTITRTSTPSSSLRRRSAAISIPTSPSRQPNMRMCTDDCAASTSAKIRGKKLSPSTSGSIVAAVDHANGSAASCGRVAVAGDERLGRRLRAGGGDRIGRRRPARPLGDPEHLPVDDDEERREREPRDRRAAASPAAPRGRW